MRKNGFSTYGIIGLGRFGLAVAEELIKLGKNVIALDKDQSRLRSLQDTSADAYVIEEVSKEAFIDAGLEDADVIIIGIGKDIESNILAALNAKEMGAERVIAKATSEDHAKILEKIGAEVIFPEVDIGNRLAKRLSSALAEDILPLSEDFSIIQIKVPESLTGKTIVEVNLRKKYGVNVIATIIDGKANGVIEPETMLSSDMALVISGSNKGLDAMQRDLSR